MTRIDFGVQIEPQFGFTYDMILKAAEAYELPRFKSIWASNHFSLRFRFVPEMDSMTILRDEVKNRLKLTRVWATSLKHA